jgi:NtrC-family two-component system response regulator AlgB
MSKRKTPVLLIDDEPNILKTMTICFEELGFQVFGFLDPSEAIKELRKSNYDLAFIDLKMSPLDGIEVLQELKKDSPETTVVIITAHGSVESAVEAMRNGAYDYLEKPFDFTALQIYARRVEEYHLMKKEVVGLRAQVRQSHLGSTIITKNPKMQKMIDLALRAAETDLSVLIEGESGTGKELIAQLIVDSSDRRDKLFTKINCAAIPENLLESEFFGHVKGAFTGAVKDRIGRFEASDGGTIFLDEIAELPPALQAKLLRFLQNQEFERVGENKTRKVDVRIIAATNRDIKMAMQQNVFREDLFYRLNSVRIILPPLRDRPEDILPLVRHFHKKYSTVPEKEFTADALHLLQTCSWHGNIRQLENTVERVVLLGRDNRIDVSELPDEIHESGKKAPSFITLDELEKQHIQYVLQNAKDKSEAAGILGIDPATLWRKRKRYNL